MAGIDYSKYSDHELAGVLYQFELSTSVLEELAVLSARVVDDLATAGIAHTQLAQVCDDVLRYSTLSLLIRYCSRGQRMLNDAEDYALSVGCGRCNCSRAD
eukprot:SAG31_NODE_29_length_32663_cov_14.779695_9_plen_101_part_00